MKIEDDVCDEVKLKVERDGDELESANAGDSISEETVVKKAEVKLESDDFTCENNVPMPEYTVRSSKGLTFVFRNRASPAPRSPTRVPPPKSSDGVADVRDIRVKLERCDEDAPSTPSPKRSRLETTTKCSDVPEKPASVKRLQVEASGDTSEDEAAVAGLLGCEIQDSHFDSSVLSDEAEVSASQLVGYCAEADGGGGAQNAVYLPAGAELRERVDLFSDGDLNLNYQGQDMLFSDFESGIETAMETDSAFEGHLPSDSQLMTAVGSLISDLGQLNEEAAVALADNQPASVVRQTPYSRLATSSSRTAESVSDASINDEMQFAISSIIGFQEPPTSSSFYDRTRFATSSTEHDSDLDAAVRSILT